MKYTLTYVNNEPIQGKFGPQVKCSIKVNGMEGFLSAFVKPWQTKDWVPTQVVDIEIYSTVSKTNGQTYQNFRIPKPEESIAALEVRVAKIEAYLKGKPTPTAPEPPEDYGISSLPF